MNDSTLLNGDIEDPFEKLIEECYWRKDLCGVYICKGECAPCMTVIDKGQCDVLKEYFRNGREQNEK